MVNLDELIKKAELGNSDAMIDLGVMYRLGKGVARDMEKCIYWTKKACSMLNPVAYQYLGYHLEIPVGYLDINDEAADYKTVYDCFFRGAMLDDPTSMYKVGDMYFTGKFVEKDQRFAFKLYKKSVELYEYPSASLNLRLAECYCFGLGTEQDIDEARKRLEDAIHEYAERESEGSEAPEFFMEGLNRARNLLKRIEADKIPGIPIYLEKNKETEEYTAFINSEMMKYPAPEHPIAELESLKDENPKITGWDDSRTFNEELADAELGKAKSMYYVAFYCFNHYGGKLESKAILDFALYYYHLAIQNGCRAAMYNLGSIYYHGDNGVAIDRHKAFWLYSYTNAHCAWGELGAFYAEGEVVEKDYEKAFKYFSKYALTNEVERYGSLINLSIMYRKGLHLEKDEKFADYCEEKSKMLEEAWKEKYGKK